MIMYAGVPLSQPTPDLVRWGRENLDWSWLPPWASREWPGRSLSRLGVGPPFPRGPARLGTLVWPSGASCFAHGLFLATDPQLAAVRAAVYPSPGGPAPAPFVLSDGVDSVATDLWMLPPRPLQQAAGAETPWLLPLVDERFFWWFRAAAVAVAADGSTTWAQLFGSLAAALGVVLSYDPVPAAYLTPAVDLAGAYEDLPPLLDAAAFSCGLRVSRGLDGAVRLWSCDSSRPAHAQNLALAQRVAGGVGVADDLPAALPASVSVAFRNAPGGTPDGTDVVRTVTLASLSLPEAAGAAGHPGTKLLRSTAAFDGANDAAVQALATQAATDYYRWRALSRHDLSLAGARPWQPTGADDAVEWTQGGGLILTRARGGPDVREDLLQYGPPDATGGSTDFTGKTVTENNTTINVTGPTTVNGPDTITYSSTSVVNNNGVTNYNSSSTVVQGGTVIQTSTTVNFSSTTVNNLTLTGGNTYIFNVVGPTTITGLVPPAGTAPGQNITIQNPTGYPIMVRPSDPGSSPGNRVKPPWGGIVGIPPNGGSIELISGGSGVPWAVDCPCWMPQLYMSVNPTVPLTGDVDDFDPETDCVLPFDPGGVDRKLTGIQGLFDGIQLLIQNVGILGDLLIPHQDPGSSPANRITTGDGGTIRVQPGGSLAITKTPTLGIVAPRPPLFQTATVYSGWVKVTRTFASFAAAATTNTVPLLTLQAKGIVQSCVVKHSAAFTGGTLTGYLLSSVGHGTPAGTQYFGASGTYAMGGAPLDNGGRYQPVPPTGYAQLQSVTVGTSINATAQSIGGNLNQATAGSVDIWFLIATLP